MSVVSAEVCAPQGEIEITSVAAKAAAATTAARDGVAEHTCPRPVPAAEMAMPDGPKAETCTCTWGDGRT